METSTLAKKAFGMLEATHNNFWLPIWLVTVIITLSLVCWRRKTPIAIPSDIKARRFDVEQDYPEVETLTDFRWQDTPPLKLRPFQPKYNLTMGMYAECTPPRSTSNEEQPSPKRPLQS